MSQDLSALSSRDSSKISIYLSAGVDGDRRDKSWNGMVRGLLIAVTSVATFCNSEALSAVWSAIPKLPFLNVDLWLVPMDT
jgi:hypothetical protein